MKKIVGILIIISFIVMSIFFKVKTENLKTENKELVSCIDEYELLINELEHYEIMYNELSNKADEIEDIQISIKNLEEEIVLLKNNINELRDKIKDCSIAKVNSTLNK